MIVVAAAVVVAACVSGGCRNEQKKACSGCPCKIISFFIFLLLEIEGFLLLEIGADFSYWKLMRARASHF